MNSRGGTHPIPFMPSLAAFLPLPGCLKLSPHFFLLPNIAKKFSFLAHFHPLRNAVLSSFHHNISSN